VTQLDKGYNLLPREGADKSFDRLESKEATATNLVIYSTYSPRSSIHFKPVDLTFCKPLKIKKIGIFSVQTGLGGSINQRVGRKMSNFLMFFSDQVGGSPTKLDPENSVGGQDTECPIRPVFVCCKRPVSRGIVV